MLHERVVETFSIFDTDGSGAIDSKELRPVVGMVLPNLDQGLIDDMVEKLDLNKDGEVDLFEFCVAIQKRTEGISEADMKMEMDEAFDLFNDAKFGDCKNGLVNEQQLRNIFTFAKSGSGKHLSDEEFELMLGDLEKQNLSVRDGKAIKLVSVHSPARAPPEPAGHCHARRPNLLAYDLICLLMTSRSRCALPLVGRSAKARGLQLMRT